MASSAEDLAYVLELLAGVPDVTTRKMMGEYLLYASGKLFGGVYDDRFLVKATPASQAALSSLCPKATWPSSWARVCRTRPGCPLAR